MLSKNPSLLRKICAISSLIATVSSADAAILFYDGFAAGGTSPGAGQYISSPSSDTGITNDSLVRTAINNVGNGQMPATTGFSVGAGTGGWKTTDNVSGGVYGRVVAGGLTYSGLTTTAGSVNIFRTTSSADAQVKTFSRNLVTGTGSGATNLYFSALMSFETGVSGQVGIAQPTNLLAFGFTAGGNVTVIGSQEVVGVNKVLATTVGTYTAGTYLLVAHVYGANLVDIYLNPTNFTDQSANAGTRILTGVALNGFALGSSIAEVRIGANTGNNIVGPDFNFDELHGATTWAEAFVVPEPHAASLALLAGLAGLARRRRA